MGIELPQDARAELIAQIRNYLEENFDVEIGDLGARLFLDFLLPKMGAAVYNLAIRDAQAFLQDRLEDLGATLWEPEA
ncbi:MAG: DUF2164 domain-containing protein [Planctomycetota bacterium]